MNPNLLNYQQDCQNFWKSTQLRLCSYEYL